ncbi:hypothetical protein POM88_042415 [Heracleum sosnowskyi]|uniref:Uncharacterized protein n=1 Tax=Heracleum sosnowskyi TaxID=360622 RepID=A0AAD8HI91_9APIA|nr:hypothetical protein POM88_042415 [Heracleum sosnowskyi]
MENEYYRIAKEIPVKRKRKIPNGGGKIQKEEENIPLVEIIKKMKRKRAAISSENEGIEVYKRGKMTSPLADFSKTSRKRAKPIEDEDGDVHFHKMCRKRAKSKEDDDDVTVMDDFYMSRKRGKSIVEEDDDDDITKIKRMQARTTRKPVLMSTPIAKKEEEEIVQMSSSSPISKKEEEIVQSSPISKKEEEEIVKSWPISKKEEEIVQMSSSSPVDEKESCFLGAGKLFDKSSDEDSEEEKKHIRRSPVYIKRYSDYVKLKLCDIKVKNKEPEQESDEELLRECQRKEVDHGYNYVLKKRFRAITNPINPQKVYYKSGIDSGRTRHVLHDPDYPLATLSKLALKTYNDIQDTEYAYVGLVKAYMRLIGGWNFWIRFKARVVGQDAINFQATICEGIRDRKTNVVPVRVESVYPLPPWSWEIFDKSSEEDSEEEKKHIRRSPVFIKRFSDRVNLELCGIKVKNKEPEQESDKELLRECDRKEVDYGFNYVLKKRFRAITNPINPQKIYYKSGIDSGRTKHVLHDPEYPLATFPKLALKTYNDIQDTEYAYVGLVKAYMRFIGGWRFWIRFKENVVGQDAINFQVIIFEAIRDRKTNVVHVHVQSVYPLHP